MTLFGRPTVWRLVSGDDASGADGPQYMVDCGQHQYVERLLPTKAWSWFSVVSNAKEDIWWIGDRLCKPLVLFMHMVPFIARVGNSWQHCSSAHLGTAFTRIYIYHQCNAMLFFATVTAACNSFDGSEGWQPPKMTAAKSNRRWHFPPGAGAGGWFLSGAQSGVGAANGGARLWQDPSFTQPRIHRTNSHNCPGPLTPSKERNIIDTFGEIQLTHLEKYNWHSRRNTIGTVGEIQLRH